MWLTKNVQVSLGLVMKISDRHPQLHVGRPPGQQSIFIANKESFYLDAGRGSEYKQNVRMSKDCQRVLELYYK